MTPMGVESVVQLEALDHFLKAVARDAQGHDPSRETGRSVTPHQPNRPGRHPGNENQVEQGDRQRVYMLRFGYFQ